jgi:hypothetical protein
MSGFGLTIFLKICRKFRADLFFKNSLSEVDADLLLTLSRFYALRTINFESKKNLG